MRVLLAGLAGGVVFFIWGAISWMVLPWHDEGIKSLPGEAAILPALRQNIGESGLYLFPPMPEPQGDPAARKQFEDRHRAGPVGWLVYHPGGREPMPRAMFVKGFVINVLSALIAAGFLAGSGARRGYVARALLAAALGLFAGLCTHVMQWNWMLLPGVYTTIMVVDLVVGWLFAGLAMAAILRREA